MMAEMTNRDQCNIHPNKIQKPAKLYAGFFIY